MTDSVSTASSQHQSISLEFDLDHPPEKVWRALTDPELLAEWLLPAIGFELEPGTVFSFRAHPQPGWDGVVHCRLLEIDPHRKLSWRWATGDLDTNVTFTLVTTASGTQLSLLHEGFREDQKKNLGGARYGWKMMTGKLAELLGRIP